MAKRTRTLTHKMKVKLVVTFFLMFVMFVGLMGRLTYINAKSGKQYEKQVLAQQNYTSRILPYARGEIQDRNGTPLATSVKIYNLILEPRNILDAEDNLSDKDKGKVLKDTIAAITKYFDVPAEELNSVIEKNPRSFYSIILKKLTYEQVEPFKKFMNTDKAKNIIGVRFEEEYKRSYPNNSLASTILGFVSSGNVGNWGLEQYYNSVLNGTNGREYGYMTDELKLERTIKQPANGNTVVSTIDVNVQRIVEKKIASFEKKIGSTKRTSVLVMDPNNGEVLAMASDNPYNLNEPFDLEPLVNTYGKSEVDAMTEEERINALNQVWKNPVVSDSFEPGSTFKPFTVAAGLEEGILTGKEHYNCTGSLKFKSWPNPIKCHSYNKGGDGYITLSEALQQSCNVAMMLINEKNGAHIFSKYQKLFGFGEKTGIDLPGEAETSSLIFNEDELSSIDLATNSFGQSFNVSMIQMGAAFSSLINGGYYYQPHIVKQILNDQGGVVETIDKTLVKRTVSKGTTEWMNEALYQTVEKGTGTVAKIKDYTVGGKTGTAEKSSRDKGSYVISFIGFMPIEDPQVLVYVTIDEIKLENQSTQTRYAVKIAHDVLKEIAPYLNVEQKSSKK